MSNHAEYECLAGRIALLERQNRWLRLGAIGVLAIAGSAVVAVLLGTSSGVQDAKAGGSRIARFEEITAGRINIAGPDGVNRIVLAYDMSGAPRAGHTLERTVPPGMAGIIFCDPAGDEVGGLGASGTEQFGHSLFALDYRHAPIEAIGFGTRYTPRHQSAGLVVMQPPTGSIDIERLAARDEAETARLQSMMIERVLLGVENSEAGLVIKDRKGRERIVISVGADDVPVVMMLDEHGKEIARLGAP